MLFFEQCVLSVYKSNTKTSHHFRIQMENLYYTLYLKKIFLLVEIETDKNQFIIGDEIQL